MLFLKTLRLVNFCGYTDHTFQFTKKDGKPYKFICFYGPNGSGKSSILNAISILSSNLSGRNSNVIYQSLQKYIQSKDYDPLMHNFTLKIAKEQSPKMLIEGVFDIGGKEYIVQVNEYGYERNDLAPEADITDEDDKVHSGPWGSNHLKYRQRNSHFVKSDSDLSMNKFQLHSSQKLKFEKIISTIMRYKIEVTDPAGFTGDEMSYCTDAIIHKKDHKIHFKRMSAGEKKICKSFSDILNLAHSLEHPSSGESPMPGWPRILLIDNVEMHVYYDRHVQMVNSLKEVFSKQQIFSTTHSGVLIERFIAGKNDQNSELMIDLEPISG